MSVPDPRTGRAVLIGVDTYTDLESLPAVAAGVRRLAELLCDPRVWGLPHDRVTVLGSAATATDVRNAIVNAGRDCTGTLVLYFAGHGLRSRDGVQLHLALRDADDGHPDIGNLTYRSVRDVLNRSAHRTSSRIVLLDCCYSGLAGAMGPGTLTRTDLRHSLSEDGDGDRDGPGACLLTSASSTGRSFAPPDAAYPDFTGALVDVLENGIHGAGPTLSVDRIWRHVHDRLREQGCPAPQQFGQNAVTRRPWVHNRAHLDGPPADVLLPRDPRQSRARRLRAAVVGVIAVVLGLGILLLPNAATTGSRHDATNESVRSPSSTYTSPAADPNPTPSVPTSPTPDRTPPRPVVSSTTPRPTPTSSAPSDPPAPPTVRERWHGTLLLYSNGAPTGWWLDSVPPANAVIGDLGLECDCHPGRVVAPAIAAWDGGAPPDYRQCSAMSTRLARGALTVRAGSMACLKTLDGRLGYIKVIDMPGPSEMNIEATVWDLR